MKFSIPAKLDTSSMKGKKFTFIQLGLNVDEITAANVFKQAMTSVGATALVFNGNGTPSTIAQAFSSSIAQHVAGIVTDGFSPTLVQTSLNAAKAANIPVVDFSTGEANGPLPAGVSAHVTVDGKTQGVYQADYELATSNCKVHTVVYYTSEGPVTEQSASGTKQELAELCGSACSVQLVDFDPATYQQSLPSQVESNLQRSPDINYVTSTSDTINTELFQGIKALGSKVKLVGGGGDEVAQAIAGSGEVADVEWPPFQLTAYYLADAIMRASLGKPQNLELPQRLVDSSNWGTSGTVSAQFPTMDQAISKIKQAWGESS
jgi:ABC-type sugar transport system substrate-binding protein